MSDNSFYSDDSVASSMANRRPKNTTNDMAVRVFERMMKASFPGPWTDNRYAQSQAFIGVPYRAIRTRMDAMASATWTVTKYKGVGATLKAMPTPGAHQSDEKYTPVGPNNPLLRLLEQPNRTETFSQIISQLELQYNLTGSCNLWTSRDQLGIPRALYSLPTSMIQAQPPTPAFPLGAWMVQQTYPGLYPLSNLIGYGAILDARDVLVMRADHPMYRWDGYSALTAGNKQLDILNSIDQARWAMMDHAAMLNLMLILPGMNTEQVEALQAKLSGTHEGSLNARRTLVLGGDVGGSDGSKWDAKLLQPDALKLDFGEGWDQMCKFCLALFGVPSDVAGLTSATNYAAFFAQLKQFNTLTLQPQAKRFGEWLTLNLAPKFGKHLRIQLDVPKIDDQETLDRQLAQDGSAGVRTVDEIRGARNLPPFGEENGGNLPPSVYVQWITAKAMPQQMGGGMADPGAMPTEGEEVPSDDGAEAGQGEQSPLTDEVGVQDAVTSAALEALGVPSAGGDGASADGAILKAHGSPPWPGAVFDEGKHRWVSGKQKPSSGRPSGGLPKNARKLTIDTATQALAKQGIKLGKGETDLATKKTLYTLTYPNGKSLTATTDKIKELVYGASEGGAAKPTPVTPSPPSSQSPQPSIRRGKGSTGIEGMVPNWATMSNEEILNTIREKTKKPAEKIAERIAEAPPAVKSTLQKAHEWADVKAQQNAGRVAAHFGISEQQAHKMLVTAIRAVAEHALKHGGSGSGTLKLNGKSLRIGVNHKPGTTGSANGTSKNGPTPPKNKSGGGSLPSRMSGAATNYKALDGDLDEACAAVLAELEHTE